MQAAALKDRYGKWKVDRPLGKGGQGTVYLAHDSSQERDNPNLLLKLSNAVIGSSPGHGETERIAAAQDLVSSLRDLMGLGTERTKGALKVLHAHDDQAAWAKALGRMQSELDTLASIKHPSLIRVLDQTLPEGWFVTEYMEHGTLEDHVQRTKGDLLASLTALRPIVEAVAQLHDKHIVHRDIKPGNIFMRADGTLVLGDCGLAVQLDAMNRLTDTYENVGSRDWMPGWAMGMRMEEVQPSFDVFSLGKVLWAMVSGKTILPLWYHHKPLYELEAMFPHDRSILWARQILDKCIVEDEDHCLGSALRLLEEVDKVINALRSGGQVLEQGQPHQCRVCGMGTYSVGIADGQDLGLACSHCGHVQTFHDYRRTPAWRKQ